MSNARNAKKHEGASLNETQALPTPRGARETMMEVMMRTTTGPSQTSPAWPRDRRHCAAGLDSSPGHPAPGALPSRVGMAGEALRGEGLAPPQEPPVCSPCVPEPAFVFLSQAVMKVVKTVVLNVFTPVKASETALCRMEATPSRARAPTAPDGQPLRPVIYNSLFINETLKGTYYSSAGRPRKA